MRRSSVDGECRLFDRCGSVSFILSRSGPFYALDATEFLYESLGISAITESCVTVSDVRACTEEVVPQTYYTGPRKNAAQPIETSSHLGERPGWVDC